jgi:hypothetical protein
MVLIKKGIEACVWSRIGIETALLKAGLGGVECFSLLVTPEGREESGSNFWQRYLDCPSIALFSCVYK